MLSMEQAVKLFSDRTTFLLLENRLPSNVKSKGLLKLVELSTRETNLEIRIFKGYKCFKSVLVPNLYLALYCQALPSYKL